MLNCISLLLANVSVIAHSLPNVLYEGAFWKILIGFNYRKKFVSAYENTCFIWSENRNDVIPHISLFVLASWTKTRKTNKNNFANYSSKTYCQG